MMNCLKELQLGDRSTEVEVVPDSYTPKKYIKHKISQEENLELFCAIDLGELLRLYDLWKKTLPTVAPYYAVKVFNDPIILKLLMQFGAGFDCASLREIKTLLELGASPDRIIFAHPCKHVSHLKFAEKENVKLMTFDNLSELQKVKMYFSSADLVIRLIVKDEDSSYPLGDKFGCSLNGAKTLLSQAFEMGLNVVGASFHVGSGCQSGAAFSGAIETCSEVFKYAASIGYNFTLLDIGGGYPGTDKMELFIEETDVINESLSKHFNREDYPDLRVIGEPGRYFSTTLAAEAVSVTNARNHYEGDNLLSRAYYISDGLYGLLSMARYDSFMKYVPRVLENRDGCPSLRSIVWGPTCSAMDKVCEVDLPELQVGDWLYFENIGAYSHVCRTEFNGLLPAQDFYYIRESDWKNLCNCDANDTTIDLNTIPSSSRQEVTFAINCSSVSMKAAEILCLRMTSGGAVLTCSLAGEQIDISIYSSNCDTRRVVSSKVDSLRAENEDVEDSFYMFDLGRVIDLYEMWTANMPGIKPYYAVKSNPDVMLLKTLAALGANFEVVNKHEMKKVLDLGVSPNRVLYTHLFKQISHLKYATKMGVDFMVFDCEEEMLKIKEYQPTAKLILRVASTFHVQDEGKWENFGVSVTGAKDLLCKAKEQDMSVIGVSFLVEVEKHFTGSTSSEPYIIAIDSCDEIFKYAAKIGYYFSFLDIGGAFPESVEVFKKIAVGVLGRVNQFKESNKGVTVIAEPGRYFSSSPFILAACVVGKKSLNGSNHYVISDGVYRSFFTLRVFPLQREHLQFATLKDDQDLPITNATFHGPAMAPDYVGSFSTPILSIGDWVYFSNMGAYKHVMINSLFSIPKPEVYYYLKEAHSNKTGSGFAINLSSESHCSLLKTAKILGVRMTSDSVLTCSLAGEQIGISIFSANCDTKKVVSSKVDSLRVENEGVEDSFYMFDLGRVIDLYEIWTACMPGVKPYYAVKCNPDAMLLKVLATLGANFEVVNKHEMKKVLDLGVSPDRVICTNPFKKASHIKYASEMGVDVMVFDCEEELLKIKACQPSARLIVRLASTFHLDEDKWEIFGASIAGAKGLLLKAKELDLTVIGVSFLVEPEKHFAGSNSPEPYIIAINACDEVFKYAAEIGTNLSLLDIGGAFPESAEVFKQMTVGVLERVNEFKRSYPGVTVIAEPGRYFASSPFVLAACVVGKKTMNGSYHYIISDGIFRSFFTLVLYPLQREKLKFATVKDDQGSLTSTATFHGPALAPDYIGHFLTPSLSLGDWVYFSNMGAYRHVMATTLFCTPKPAIHYYIKETHRQKLGVLLSELHF